MPEPGVITGSDLTRVLDHPFGSEARTNDPDGPGHHQDCQGGH
jgi:hypothetical protein